MCIRDRAKEGRESLTLHVYRENSPAVRFYQREGFAIRAAEQMCIRDSSWSAFMVME